MTDTVATATPGAQPNSATASQPVQVETPAAVTPPVDQSTQSTEQQPAGDKPAESAPVEDKPADPAPKAPEQYEFTAPEGQTFDPAVIGVFSEVAKELDLPQDSAQKILDKVMPALAAQQIEEVTAIRAEWTESAKADKEIGGTKLDENLGTAKRALEAFSTPEFVKWLDASGLGSHPEMIRTFLRVGKATGGDTLVVGDKSTGQGDKSAAQRLYPNMNP